ncbi:patatin-like phospholipase family protein [Fulvivirga sediminis]|uniref:Patatin-like phospholipase family protein n=1 Tax=Fulvivirga sediminis TaxID=2803949 RepID=A0A937F738_9BACT|nr:patatin-like phospholipase family protein [Fulvivirga sediminis]MBL3655530.1 patatin-like phospholipase family protein [Fulvivirga sediminis]
MENNHKANSSVSVMDPKAKKKVRILSLDGGGIRGVISAFVLKYAEEYLQEKAPGTSLSDHFDLIAGTSTGGILTGIYLAPESEGSKRAKFSANDALKFYVDEGFNIFNKSQRSSWKRFWGLGNATSFDSTYLRELLQDKLGDMHMSDLLKPCLIPTYNMNTKSSFFFISREDRAKREFYVRDALISTASAPTYFPPVKIKNIAPSPCAEEMQLLNIDGGVFANNPLMCAYAEARSSCFEERNNECPTAEDMYILSIGTGGGVFDIPGISKSHKWSLLKWAKTVPEIMMDGSADTVTYQMNRVYGTLKPDAMGDFLRIDTPDQYRTYNPDMTDASEKNIDQLLRAAEKTLVCAQKNGLDAFLDGLLDEEIV